MTEKGLKGWYAELRRRNVVRVAAAYVVGAWFVLQVFDLAADILGAPSWAMKYLFLLLCGGFVFSLIVSWAFEITPDGIKREAEVERNSSPNQFLTKRLDVVTILLLISTVVLVMWTRDWISEPDSSGQNESNKISTAITDAEVPTVDINPNSIAVLPFTNMANAAENESFTIGIHDDLLTQLSKIEGLKVISRTSVLRYRDTVMSIGDIAQELGVAHILEGGVQRAGDKIRINVQLIDSAQDGHLWAENYDRELSAGNIFEIQSDITAQIAQALKTQLNPAQTAPSQSPPTNNLEAYNLVHRARQLLLTRLSSNIKESETLFSQAIELDPNYAQAYAGLADSIVMLYSYTGLPYDEMRTRVRPLLDKAIELDPESVEAHASMGLYLRYTGDFTGAEESFKTALSISQNYASAFHWYSSLLRRLGRNEESLELIQKAVELDPMSPSLQEKLGKSLQALGDYEGALSQYKKAVQLNPEFASALSSTAFTYRRLGKLDLAAQWLVRAWNLNPEDALVVDAFGGVLLNLGMLDEAQELLTNAEQRNSASDALVVFKNHLFEYTGNSQAGLDFMREQKGKFIGNKRVHAKLVLFHYLAGNYDQAIAARLANYQRESVDQINFSPGDVYQAPELISALKHLGRDEEAKKVAQKATLLLLRLPLGERYFTHAAVLAADGDPNAAAEAFAAAVESGARANWWQLLHRPYLGEVRGHSVFKQAWETLMTDIKLQRERFRASQQQDDVASTTLLPVTH